MVTKERIFLPTAYNNSTGQLDYPLTRRVVPGMYEIYYYNTEADVFWPINDNARLMQNVDLTSDKTRSSTMPSRSITAKRRNSS